MRTTLVFIAIIIAALGCGNSGGKKGGSGSSEDSGAADSGERDEDTGQSDTGAPASPCGEYLPWDRPGAKWRYGLDPAEFSFTMDLVIENRGEVERDDETYHQLVSEGEYDIPDVYDFFRWTDDEAVLCDGDWAGVRYSTNYQGRSSDGRVTEVTTTRVYTGAGEWKVDPIVGDAWEADMSYDSYYEGELEDHVESIWTYEVVGEESVSVPAGDFDALKIDVNGGEYSLFVARGVGLVLRSDGFWLESFEAD